MKALSEKSSVSKKRRLITISSIIAVLLIGGGVAGYFVMKQQQQANEDKQRDASTVKEEQAQSAEQKKVETQLPSKSDSQNQTSQPPMETPSTPPEKPVIERAGGDPTIKIVATFRQASPGSCELQLTAPGQTTKNYTSTIVVSSSYYTCSFSIARNSIPAAPWSAVVIHHIGNASTSSDTRSLD